MHRDKTVSVIGLGYIGLPTAVVLANSGYKVLGVDTDPSVVANINRCETHISEPELDAFLHAAVSSGQLKAAVEPSHADIYIICVPTPLKKAGEMPRPDLEHVMSAAKSIAPFIQQNNLIVLESTSPVGTTERVRDLLIEAGVNSEVIYLAYCPERVLPGRIIQELVENDRIVGGINDVSTEQVSAFYRSFVRGSVLCTDSRTAEMCKLAENSYRDVNIAFANELSMLCDSYDINASELISLANHHPRVNILSPGCGVGGHCIAIDPWFIVSDAPEQSNLIRTARITNDSKRDWFLRKVEFVAKQFEKEKLRKPVIACLGLAYKPDIDDLRESPALYITQSLVGNHHEVLVVEPNISNHDDFELVSADDAIKHSDIVVFLVRHKEFISLDMGDKLVVDPCDVSDTFSGINVV